MKRLISLLVAFFFIIGMLFVSKEFAPFYKEPENFLITQKSEPYKPKKNKA